MCGSPVLQCLCNGWGGLLRKARILEYAIQASFLSPRYSHREYFNACGKDRQRPSQRNFESNFQRLRLFSSAPTESVVV